MDAAMQAEFANDGLFPKRGKELNYTVNGKPRITRGALGESAVITVNGNEADIHTPIHANDQIKVIESTAGEAARLDIDQLPEFGSVMRVEVNDTQVDLPKFASVNGSLQSGYYSIQEGDCIEILNYYTVRQIAEFMDVIINQDMNIYVNNKLADMDSKVYENFSVVWTMEQLQLSDRDKYENEVADSFDELPEDDGTYQRKEETADREADWENVDEADMEQGTAGEQDDGEQVRGGDTEETLSEGQTDQTAGMAGQSEAAGTSIYVTVNNDMVHLTGKMSYMFVDVFEHIDFDLSKPQGSGIVTRLNGRDAQYMEEIGSGDRIEIYWRR